MTLTGRTPYENMDDIINDVDVWGRFDFSHYHRDEVSVLKPALEAKGFTNIYFVMGECDSFGPLSRVACVTDPQGNRRKLVYG